MATEIQTTIPDYVFTSALENVTIATDLSRLSVVVEIDGAEAYKTTLNAYDGAVTLYDVRSIIEESQRKSGRSYSAVEIVYKSDSGEELGRRTLNAIYSRYAVDMDAKVFAEQHFLSTIETKRSYRQGMEYVSALDMSTERAWMTAECVYRSTTGMTEVAEVNLKDIEPREIGVNVYEIKYEEVLGALEASVGTIASLLAYTIKWGSRRMTYYVSEGSPEVSFTFRNSFNALETVQVAGVTKQKLKVERTVAQLGRYRRFYDEQIDQEYEVETTALTDREARWIEQIAMSSAVWLGVGGEIASLPEVMITESTCEISDSNAELNRVKLTWTYRDRVPKNRTIATDEGGIYQEQFTYQYQ